MEKSDSQHPCFNKEARDKYARIHLPIAPACNIQCNFCNRQYDCQNESRPGVTSALLTPKQALEYLKKANGVIPNISVVGIAGPGDPFATPEITMETLRLVRSEFKDVHLCVATNGLNLASYVPELKSLNVSHVTVTINAIYPSIGAKIYAWVRNKKKIYRKEEGAKELFKNQKEAVLALAREGITTKINTVVMAGINYDHVVDIAKEAKRLGADIVNCIPMYPVQGAVFEEMPPPKPSLMREIRTEVAKHLEVMNHCTRCRADAAGLLTVENTQDLNDLLRSATLSYDEKRPYVAVASREGLLVNQHLGETSTFRIFERAADGFKEITRRPAPKAGGGYKRWQALANTLRDCRAVLVADLGERPRSALEENGLKVIVMEGIVENGLQAVYEGKEIRSPARSTHRCGSGCSGNGMGCG